MLKRIFLYYACILHLLVAYFTIIPAKLDAQASQYFGEKTVVRLIPPKDKKMRLLIVSDATNEIDDIWAISLAILYPERFIIEGFVGSNYDHTGSGIGPKSIDLSVKEIQLLLEKAGMKGRYPVYPGGHPMQYEFQPSPSAGCDFIIERAMAGTPQDPLWIVGLGAATDLASAYLKEPAIRDRVVFFWHGRTHPTWPYRAVNYNVKGDMHAARMLFHAPLPLILFDTGTNLFAGDMEESSKYIRPFGELGQYLFDYRLKHAAWSKKDKAMFDLGDIAVLIDPDIGKWEQSVCPTVSYYMDYNFYKTNGCMLRCLDIDREKTYRLLYDRISRTKALLQ